MVPHLLKDSLKRGGLRCCYCKNEVVLVHQKNIQLVCISLWKVAVALLNPNDIQLYSGGPIGMGTLSCVLAYLYLVVC